MRRLILALGLSAVLAGAAQSADAPPLTLEVIQAMEAQVTLPQGSRPFATYDRYYALDTAGGVATIQAVFIHRSSGQGTAKIVEPGKLPVIYDGGCSIIDAAFDPASKRTLRIACHGMA